MNANENMNESTASREVDVEDAKQQLDRLQEIANAEMSKIVGGYGDFWEGDASFRIVPRSSPLGKIGS